MLNGHLSLASPYMLAEVPTWLSELAANKYALAVFSALVAFIFSTILERNKRKKAPRKALSWSLKVNKKLIEVSRGMAAQVKVYYDGHLINELVDVRYRLENTGNTVVKNQFIRFSYPEDAEILEEGPHPVPKPEIGVEKVEDGPNGVRYRIAHLEKGSSVDFKFVADGGSWSSWERGEGIHPFNEEGDVGFERQGVSMVREDQEHVRPFVSLFIVLVMLLPLIVLPIVEPFGVAAIAVWLVTAALIIRHIRPVSRIVERIIQRMLGSGNRDLSFDAVANDESRIFQAGQDMYITLDGKDGKKLRDSSAGSTP